MWTARKLCEQLATATNDLKEKPEWKHRCAAMLVIAEKLRTDLEEFEDENNNYFREES